MRYLIFLLMIMTVSCTGLYVEETPKDAYINTSNTDDIERISRKYREFDESFQYDVDELRIDGEKKVELEDIWER